VRRARSSGRWSRPLVLAAVFAVPVYGCAAARPTPDQQWVTERFADCKARTNAINVRLDRVWPDGSWHASGAQTRIELDRCRHASMPPPPEVPQ